MIHFLIIILYRQALFGLEDYNAALKAFQSLKPLLTSSSSNTIDKDNNISSIVTPTLIDVEQWIRKCTAELEGVITITETENNNNNNLPPFKPKFEWYQTNTHLTIAYLSKEINQASSSITIDEKSINVKLVGPISTSPFITCINLYESVQPDQAVTTYRATKVEIRIPKVPGANFMWPTLESTTSTISSNAIKAKLTGIATTPSSSSSTTTPVPVVASTGTSKPLPTPYASQKNWDALEKEVLKEEENEKPEGEEALQKLFRQIYKDGDEDTRRAMIKSFQTSGGTVLSTNWKDVAQHDYEKEGIKAPDGMEVRKWNTN